MLTDSCEYILYDPFSHVIEIFFARVLNKLKNYIIKIIIVYRIPIEINSIYIMYKLIKLWFNCRCMHQIIVYRGVHKQSRDFGILRSFLSHTPIQMNLR